ncbi:MAG: Glucanase [Candidatus Saccharibacteria bacterium]|nr:Glucanase [Candidatus Saccharibacteria bacterium]
MSRPFIFRLLAILLIIIAAGATAYAVLASNKKVVDQNIVFSPHTLLAGTWNSYKTEYWEASTGRTLDKQQNDITTSEGQSYTMLRAVWESDKPTFDKSWAWTKEQLQRQDKLFSWRWGKKTDSTYGVLTDVNGQNAASDADSDIALSLLMAADRWQDATYLNEAKAIISSMYNNEVVTVAGVPYLASNNLEKRSSSPIVMNPSYLAPYAYREFAKVDTQHNWTAVIDSTYSFLAKAMSENLDKTKTDGMPPDWVLMDRTTGALSAPTVSSLTTNYGFDAMRTPWRIALDYKWNKDIRSKDLLEKMSFLSDQWNSRGALYSTYSHDGNVVTKDEVAESYGTALAYFDVVDSHTANQIYDQKIKTLYDQNTNAWKQDLTYYASNWVWFGIALHEDQLPNLAADLRVSK